MDRFAALAIEWVKKKQGSVLAFAGPNEEPLIHHFLSAIDDLLSSVPSAESRILTRAKILTTYQLNLRALAGVLSQVSVSIGNDSGNKHLAISVGTPTITLFGPEDPYEWHPYSPDQHPYFFIESLPCRREGDPGMPPWCGLSECIEEEHRCMRLIGVEPVLKAAQKMARTHLNQKNLNLSGTKTVLGTKSP
jgi:heptosyltransferase-2